MAQTVTARSAEVSTVSVPLPFGLDQYTLQARLVPMMVVLFPAGALAGALANWKTSSAAPSAFIGVFATYGGAVLLAEFGRDRGKKKEADLYRLWGGKPSTAMLRHRSNSFNTHTLRRYHQRLGELLPDIRLPSGEQEAANKAAADAVYESCGDYLRSQTKETSRFERLFAQNVSFGLRRNLWAMKSYALILGLLCLIASASMIVINARVARHVPSGWLTSALLDLFLLAAWVWIVRPDWVRIPAEEYARQLISCCEDLEPQPLAPPIITSDKN